MAELKDDDIIDHAATATQLPTAAACLSRTRTLSELRV